MKTLKKIFILLAIGTVFIAGISCEQISNDSEPTFAYCYNAKIIKVTCGGTVVQILRPDNIGSNWIDATEPSKPSYTNCVLVGNIPSEKQMAGSLISVKYKIVTEFEDGNFCDIGGLPPVKAVVIQFYNNCEINNN